MLSQWHVKFFHDFYASIEEQILQNGSIVDDNCGEPNLSNEDNEFGNGLYSKHLPYVTINVIKKICNIQYLDKLIIIYITTMLTILALRQILPIITHLL